MTLNLELQVRRPSGARLVQHYVSARPEALAFYRGPPDDPGSFVEKGREVAGRFDREARAAACTAIHTRHPDVTLKLDEVVDRGGVFVTTGQQPGLFTGPLYSLYKGLTAVRLAAELERVLDLPAMPLFWVASEDHDWAEVDHTYLVSTDNDLERLAMDGPRGRDERPLHRVALDDDISSLVERFGSLFPDNDFKADFLTVIREAYAPGATMGQAFRDALEHLLGPLGVGFVDAANPELKRLSRPVLIAALDEAERDETLLADNARRLGEAGYDVQVPVLPEGVNLFLEGPAGRERVYRDGDGFRLRHSGQELSRDDVVARLDEDPLALSPNVLLRPIVESTVFPVVSYVAGPGEMAYYAQIADLFDVHGIRMPVIYPRFGVTVIEGKTRKVLDKFGLAPEDLGRPHHRLAGEIVREGLPDEIRQALGALRGGIAKGTAEVASAVAAVDPTLKGPAGHVRSVAFAALDDLNKKIVQSLKRENEIALTQLEKAQLHLFPEGRPQERSLNAFYYLMRYGGGFLEALVERFEVAFGSRESA